MAYNNAIRSGAIRVHRIVVVDVARRVHIPRIVRVAAVGRPFSLRPVIFGRAIKPAIS